MYKSGIYNDPEYGYQLDHGVLLVGYGYDSESELDYWKIKIHGLKHGVKEGIWDC